MAQGLWWSPGILPGSVIVRRLAGHQKFPEMDTMLFLFSHSSFKHHVIFTRLLKSLEQHKLSTNQHLWNNCHILDPVLGEGTQRYCPYFQGQVCWPLNPLGLLEYLGFGSPTLQQAHSASHRSEEYETNEHFNQIFIFQSNFVHPRERFRREVRVNTNIPLLIPLTSLVYGHRNFRVAVAILN